uniref:Uncharacterized protein n=1 Tax=Rhizophora mucronata TaxID=61149 RepID=A0A2P2JW76_RHIMU
MPNDQSARLVILACPKSSEIP